MNTALFAASVDAARFLGAGAAAIFVGVYLAVHSGRGGLHPLKKQQT